MYKGGYGNQNLYKNISDWALKYILLLSCFALLNSIVLMEPQFIRQQ